MSNFYHPHASESIINSLNANIEFAPMPYEIDFTGFASNTNASRWMEQLRIKMMTDHFTAINVETFRPISVIRKSTIEYLLPIRLSDRILGSAWVETLMSTSWQISFSFSVDRTKLEAIRATQTGVFIDATNFKPVRIPRAFIARICGQSQNT